MRGIGLKTFLTLVRVPTVFSSMSNAYAGWFIAGGRGFTAQLAFGIAAAACFIMAGMALNDVADRKVDAVERPDRPIPSGAAPLGLVWTLSLLLLALGLLLVSAANPVSLVPAGFLVLAIFAYNFLLKSTWLGPGAMGLCRLLNLLTGMSLAWTGWSDMVYLPDASQGALLSLWAYIALVTYLARDEVQGNSRRKARAFIAGLSAWFLVWGAAVLSSIAPGRSIPVLCMAAVWLGHALFLWRPLRALLADPSPRHTGRSIGALLRTVPLADVMAMLMAGAPLAAALPGVLWILPAWLVGRMFYST